MALGAEADPFAAYHKAIEERLAAMSEADGAAPRKALEIPVPSERKSVPPITAGGIARKFRGGRDAEVAPQCRDWSAIVPHWRAFWNGRAFPKASLRWCWWRVARSPWPFLLNRRAACGSSSPPRRDNTA